MQRKTEQPSIIPPMSNIMIYVNPFSGTGKARQILPHVIKMLDKAHVTYKVHSTERANDARERASELDMNIIDSIVTISGDGLFHEVINGLCNRSDWELI